MQVGADINGEAADDLSGYFVSLSSDGSRVAIGARENDGVNGANSGHVRVYNYTPSGTTSWTQLGDDIDGEEAGDLSGHSVSLSSDGSRVAIGALENDGNGSNSGHVRVYKYDSGYWTKVGGDIDGAAAKDLSGQSVSLSSDGLRVAIGAHGNDAHGPPAGYELTIGHVRIFDYNTTTQAWDQVGAEIDGDGVTDRLGYSVSLSSDGSIVAIGAYSAAGGGTNRGHVRVYKYNSGSWTKVGGDINGEANYASSGYSVSLSSDGSKVAVGENRSNGNKLVKVYSQFPSPATLAITSNDSDNVITTGQVTLTATFSQNMTASPKISIAGVVTNVSMTQSTTAAVWTYYWQVPSSISSGTTLNVTATATDSNSLSYSGNASLTLTISPTFYLASNVVTIKCSGCSAGDTGMVSGTTYTAHDNTSLANKSRTDTDWDRVVTTLVTDMSSLFD